MGTDELGRDVFSRIIFGAQVPFQFAVYAVLVGLTGEVLLECCCILWSMLIKF